MIPFLLKTCPDEIGTFAEGESAFGGKAERMGKCLRKPI
jgi:hypothetical protein